MANTPRPNSFSAVRAAFSPTGAAGTLAVSPITGPRPIGVRSSAFAQETLGLIQINDSLASD